MDGVVEILGPSVYRLMAILKTRPTPPPKGTSQRSFDGNSQFDVMIGEDVRNQPLSRFRLMTAGNFIFEYRHFPWTTVTALVYCLRLQR